MKITTYSAWVPRYVTRRSVASGDKAHSPRVPLADARTLVGRPRPRVRVGTVVTRSGQSDNRPTHEVNAVRSANGIMGAWHTLPRSGRRTSGTPDNGAR